MSPVESKTASTGSIPFADQQMDTIVLIGLYVLQKGRFSYVNAQTAYMLGYGDPFELTGIPLRQLVLTEDLNRIKLVSDSGGRPGVPATPKCGTFRMIGKDGRTIRVSMKGDCALYKDKPANVGCIVDMTAIAQLEQALEKYRTMLNQVDDAVAEMDLHGNILFSNTSVCRKWETLGDKSKPLNFRTYVDEGSVDKFIQAYKQVYDTGVAKKHITYKVKLADGRRLTVEDAVSLMRDDKGAVTGFRILSRNITDRKKAEKRLAQQRTQLKAIFRSVNDVIITVTPELKIIKTNLSEKTFCGLDPQASEGQPFSQCPAACKKACLQLLRQTIREKKAVKEQQVFCGHTRNRQQVVNISSSPLLDYKGNFVGVVLVIRDMTRLKIMEAQLHERHRYKNIITKNKTMTQMLEMVQKLSRLGTTVLITGESGTGKELIAKALHYNGPRATKPFISVNCAALNENLLESELFGHVKGAFTGAIRDKKGRFEAADGGTILLDEIGDISPLLQLKLLRVLQEKEFERVGEATPTKVDVRVIACTNKDLKAKIKDGTFREDLYYRLNVLQIPLPPLRERIEDIPLLADHFCRLFSQRLNKRIKGTSTQVMNSLSVYSWPGNVRELEHVIERACILCRGSEILMTHLPAELNNGARQEQADPRLAMDDNGINRAQDIIHALNQTQWNRTNTARMLGISRQTLYRKIKAYRINEIKRNRQNDEQPA